MIYLKFIRYTSNPPEVRMVRAVMAPKSKQSKHAKKFKTKLHLVFNEEKRREFLTGFHKRKLQRKKKAKETLEQQLKEDKKRLKAEAREQYKKLVKSYAPLPEVENLLAEEYEDDDVNVKVVELSTSETAKQNNWIGVNQPHYKSDDETEESSDVSDSEKVPGMELNPKPKPKPKKVDKKPAEKVIPTTKVNIKKILKKQATNNVKKSKAFQMKNNIERQKQKKKSIQKKRLKMKLENKTTKRKGNRR